MEKQFRILAGLAIGLAFVITGLMVYLSIQQDGAALETGKHHVPWIALLPTYLLPVFIAAIARRRRETAKAALKDTQ
jgi:hypothetical protein